MERASSRERHEPNDEGRTVLCYPASALAGMGGLQTLATLEDGKGTGLSFGATRRGAGLLGAWLKMPAQSHIRHCN